MPRGTGKFIFGNHGGGILNWKFLTAKSNIIFRTRTQTERERERESGQIIPGGLVLQRCDDAHLCSVDLQTVGQLRSRMLHANAGRVIKKPGMAMCHGIVVEYVWAT